MEKQKTMDPPSKHHQVVLLMNVLVAGIREFLVLVTGQTTLQLSISDPTREGN